MAPPTATRSWVPCYRAGLIFIFLLAFLATAAGLIVAIIPTGFSHATRISSGFVAVIGLITICLCAYMLKQKSCNPTSPTGRRNFEDSRNLHPYCDGQTISSVSSAHLNYAYVPPPPDYFTTMGITPNDTALIEGRTTSENRPSDQQTHLPCDHGLIFHSNSSTQGVKLPSYEEATKEPVHSLV